MISNRQLFLRHIAQTSDDPMLVEISHGKGVFLYNPEGKRYFDFISGIAVSNVGHCAPEVVQALRDQSEKYLHSMVYGEFVMSPQVKFAEKLVGLLGPELDSIYFVNSGSEAVEGGLKLAKKFTGRSHIVSMNHSYHGSTHGALSVTGAPELKAGYGPFLPNVTFIDFNDAEALSAITDQTACIIVEAVQGEAGIIWPQDGYLQAIRKRCDETGALLIIDEIQTGQGRAGAMYAHQRFDVRPDILLLAKGLGGGMPLGAFIASKKVMGVLTHDPVLGHISTFGGHSMSCTAGLAALEKIINEELIAQIPAKEALIRKKLAHPKVKEIRGAGLMFAAVVDNFEQVKAVIESCLELGLITDWFLHCDYAIRIAPPLTISLSELEESLDILITALDRLPD